MLLFGWMVTVAVVAFCATEVLVLSESSAATPPAASMCDDFDRAARSEADGDLRRNFTTIKAANLCYQRLSIDEEPHLTWGLHVLQNLRRDGPAWFVPHDDETVAFDAAVHAGITYGGRLVAVESDGRRRFRGIDPNRNFAMDADEAEKCGNDVKPAPRFAEVLEQILPYRIGEQAFYFALQTNADGWFGNGGRGTISANRSSSRYQPFRPSISRRRVSDEDNMILFSGTDPFEESLYARALRQALNEQEVNFVYEHVTAQHYDCSMSNFVAQRNLGVFFKIEAEHGDFDSLTTMIGILMATLEIEPVSPEEEPATTTAPSASTGADATPPGADQMPVGGGDSEDAAPIAAPAPPQ